MSAFHVSAHHSTIVRFEHFHSPTCAPRYLRIYLRKSHLRKQIHQNKSIFRAQTVDRVPSSQNNALKLQTRDVRLRANGHRKNRFLLSIFLVHETCHSASRLHTRRRVCQFLFQSHVACCFSTFLRKCLVRKFGLPFQNVGCEPNLRDRFLWHRSAKFQTCRSREIHLPPTRHRNVARLDVSRFHGHDGHLTSNFLCTRSRLYESVSQSPRGFHSKIRLHIPFHRQACGRLYVPTWKTTIFRLQQNISALSVVLECRLQLEPFAWTSVHTHMHKKNTPARLSKKEASENVFAIFLHTDAIFFH